MKIKPTSEKVKSAPKVSSRSHLGDTSCVPELRFPHFTTPWKTIPLSRLLRFQNGVNAPAEKYGRGIKFVSVSDIIQNDYVTYDNIVGSVDIDDGHLRSFRCGQVARTGGIVTRRLTAHRGKSEYGAIGYDSRFYIRTFRLTYRIPAFKSGGSVEKNTKFPNRFHCAASVVTVQSQ